MIIRHANILIILLIVAFTFSANAETKISNKLNELIAKAKSGDNIAAFKYAERLKRGLPGSEPDNKKAAYWFKLSAQQGNAEAALALAAMYDANDIKPPSETAAKELYEYAYRILKADADNNLASAATRLGLMFFHGQGVAKDPDLAIKWLQRGVDLGSPQAKLTLGRATIWGSTPGYTTDQAMELLHDAAEMGIGSAWLQIGLAYSGAFGGNINHPRAVAAFRKAYESGNSPEGTRQYGISHLTGFGVKKDPKYAAELTIKAAELGSGDAMYSMALLYRHGIGVKQSKRAEIEWLKRASKYKSIDAMYHLAIAYRDGNGVKQSNELALEYFKKAQVKKHVLAIRDYNRLKEKINPTPEPTNQVITKTPQENK